MRAFPFQNLYDLVREGRPRAALDIVFFEFDAMFREGDFQSADSILPLVDLDKLDPTHIVGFLTITKSAETHLPNRSAFVERARPWLIARLGAERATNLLKSRS